VQYEKLSASLHAALVDVGIEVDQPVHDDRPSDQRRVSIRDGIELLRSRSVFVNVCDEVRAEDRVEVGVEAVARVFVVGRADTDLENLGTLGIEFDRPLGDVWPASVMLAAFDGLTDSDDVIAVEAASVARPHLDLARVACNVDQFVNASGNNGAGVIIGIVDTGIDGTHPAFAGRILSVWDQTIAGPGVAEGKYGLELPGGLAATDPRGHGTHVAGIAAGADALYSGIAPGAHLVVVKTDFDTSKIASGVRYVFRIASEWGVPAVVNLSLGYHNNPHDGSDAFSTGIASIVGPGRIVCASAGNEGNDVIHAELYLGVDRQVEQLVVDVGGSPPRRVWMTAWYERDTEVEFRIVSPDGATSKWQGPLTGQAAARTYFLTDAQVQISSPPPSASDQGHNVVVELRAHPTAASVTPGTWTIEVRNVGANATPVHAWLIESPNAAPTAGFTTWDTNAYKIGAPAAADGVIAVGATVTKTSWVDTSQAAQSTMYVEGDLAEFSSPGPLRSGVEKPDVCAPGSMIASAKASQFSSDPSDTLDAVHVMMQGTSMSCPIVTGLIALMLAADNTLDPPAVRAALVAASSIPGLPAGSFDPGWGYGLIDATSL
jgi:subtilisin family serine protease